MEKKSLSLLIIILIIAFFFMQTQVREISVFSIDKVDYKSIDPHFNEPAFLVYFKLIGSQSLLGTIKADVSSDEIVDKIDKKGAEKGFTFENTYLSQKCVYNLKEGKEIGSYAIKIKCVQGAFGEYLCPDAVVFPDWVPGVLHGKDYCESRGGDIWITPLGVEGWCIEKKLNGFLGRVTDRTNEFRARFKLTVDNYVMEKTISNTMDVDARGNLKGTMAFGTYFELGGKKVAYLNWEGNLQSGRSCPVTEGLTPVKAPTYTGGFPPITTKWKMVDNHLINSYISEYQSLTSYLEACQLNAMTCDGKVVFAKIKATNDLISEILSDEGRISVYPQTSTADRITVEITDPIYYPTYPVFTLHIKAETIGIRELVPKPEFIEREISISGTAGKTVYVSPHLKNTGETGEINLYMICESGYYFSGKTEVGGGETKSILIPIKLAKEITEEYRDTCKLTASARGGESTVTILVNWKPRIICKARIEYKCVDDDLYVCNAYGTGWELSKHCPYGCDPVHNRCKGAPPECTTDADCDDHDICTLDKCINGKCKYIFQDRDYDGVCDAKDKCPDKHGVPEYSGCPAPPGPCDIKCPFGDFNCYNRIINCWINEIVKSVKLMLTILGVIVILGLLAYAVISMRKRPPEKT